MILIRGESDWEYHSSFSGCPYGYSVKNVQTDTEKVAVGSYQESAEMKQTRISPNEETKRLHETVDAAHKK